MNPYDVGGQLCEERWTFEEYANSRVYMDPTGSSMRGVVPISGDALAVVRHAQAGAGRIECRFRLNGDRHDAA